MIAFAAGYQHFADGVPFAEIVLRHASVKEVYFPWMGEPSGRPKLGFEEEDDPAELEAALRRDLTRLRKAGVRLDLLLNANCYGAEAMGRKLEDRIGDILATLSSWGCGPEVCTTASPFVAHVLKETFPEIEVRASVNMRLTTLQAFRYLAPLFDSYYLGRDVQRNLETVKKFSEWCYAHGKKLCILANSGCLRNCPWQTFHDNLIAHSDEAMKVENVKGWCPHLCWTLYKDACNFPGGSSPLRRTCRCGEACDAPARQSRHGDLRVRARIVRRQSAGPVRARILPGVLPAFHRQRRVPGRLVRAYVGLRARMHGMRLLRRRLSRCLPGGFPQGMKGVGGNGIIRGVVQIR